MSPVRTMVCSACGHSYAIEMFDNLRAEKTFGAAPGPRPAERGIVECRACGSVMLLQFENLWRPVMVDFRE